MACVEETNIGRDNGEFRERGGERERGFLRFRRNLGKMQNANIASDTLGRLDTYDSNPADATRREGDPEEGNRFRN